MAERQPVDRRTVLERLCAAGVVATGATGAATATRTDTHESTAEASAEEESTSLTGIYRGTVDRVVDGAHVVILIESGGRVVDQHVVSAQDNPSLVEGQSVILLVLFGWVLAVLPTG